MLRGAMEAQGRVGLMLNVQVEDLQAVLSVLPALNSPTISALERQDMGCGQHDYGGVSLLGSDSPPEGGQCSRHCRVSAEQGGDVMRILEGKAAERAVMQLERRSSCLDEVEPRVRKVVQDVKTRRRSPA